MKKLHIVSVVIVALFTLFTNAQAQTENPPVTKNNAVNISVQPIPYSAEAASENIQTLIDGNKITRTTKEIIYADGKGRVRRETETVLGNNRIQKSINIRDTPADVDYYLNPLTKIAYRTPIKGFSPSTQKVASIPSGFSTKLEPLGKKIIEGFEATGSRVVTTIAAGVIGNEKPIEMISESWFSLELRNAVLSKRSDPQNGNYSYALKNIKREEPDPKLFTVPADYKIVDSANVSDRFFAFEPPQ